ncbi:MAG: hypothetical protein U1F48_13915 [Burkholderiales bacterium]
MTWAARAEAVRPQVSIGTRRRKMKGRGAIRMAGRTPWLREEAGVLT